MIIGLDWDRYNKLIAEKDFSEMTEDEKSFFRFMYLAEEHLAGLDGDLYE